jgi:hypothetical protein
VREPMIDLQVSMICFKFRLAQQFKRAGPKYFGHASASHSHTLISVPQRWIIRARVHHIIMVCNAAMLSSTLTSAAGGTAGQLRSARCPGAALLYKPRVSKNLTKF